MADLRISPEELQPVVRQVVEAVLGEIGRHEQRLNGKLAVPETEAAALLITHSRIVGGRIRNTADDLLDYLRRTRDAGTEKGR
jgi:hypothetical protein